MIKKFNVIVTSQFDFMDFFLNYVSCIMRLDDSFLSVWLVHSFSHQGHGGQGFTKPSS